MYLLDLFEAKAAFIFMVAVLIIIPIWIGVVAFSRRGKEAGREDESEEKEPTEESA